MLAGIFDRRGGNDLARRRRRLESAFGRGIAASAQLVGPLAVASGEIGAGSRAYQATGRGAGCALEGSIYNLAEVASEMGVDASDPEPVLAQAYDRSGPRMLEKLRGGFALVAWSHDAQTVLLAQDQVGLGALFLHRDGDELLFASEIHHLLRLLPRTPGPDTVAVARSLALLSLYDGITMFEGVRRLGAARMIEINREGVSERKYWTASYEPPLEGSRLEVAAELKAALVRSVRLRTRRADSVGITLSGGFDSSATAAAAASVKSPGQALTGYSAVFADDPSMDERDLLDALIEALPLSNLRFEIAPGGVMEVALAFVRDWRLPLSGPGWAMELPLMRQAAADGVRVMLDGQSGDETFGGAPYLLADRLRAGRVLAAIELIRSEFPRRRPESLPWSATARLLTSYGLAPALPHPLYVALRGLSRGGEPAPRFMNEQSARLLRSSSDRLRWTRHGSDGPRWWLGLRQLLAEDGEAAGLGDFTRQRSRWVGIEGRPPLFDLELIQTSLRIPPEYRFDRYLDRPIGREAVAGLLPDPLRLSRRKSNLAPFYYRALSGADLPAIRALLGEKRLEIGQWVRPDVLRELLENPPALRSGSWEEWLNTVWGCVSIECWLRSLSDASFAEEMLAGPLVPRLKYTWSRAA